MPSLEQNLTKVTRLGDITQARYEREIKIAYRTALKSIQGEMAWLYEKYADEGVLTYAEMTRYNRLDGLEREIAGILGENDRTVKRTLNKLTGEQYEQAYFSHAWAIEQDVGVALKWGGLRPEDIKAIVNNPLSLIAKDSLTQTERTRIRRAITQGLIRGESYPQMARDIRTTMESSFKDALRIARTEAHRAQIEGTLETYNDAEDLGVEIQRIWVASLDDRTRDSHAALDGEPAEERDGEYMWNVGGTWAEGPGLTGDPAEDINCRCTVREEIVGLEPKLRRTREGGIEPYLKYEDWREKYG
jgi:SPP1 gp7 family putative phage head morphogenesis protein